MTKAGKNFVLGIFAGLICFNILAWLAVFDLSKPKFLEVNFFDVGQGDAIFIETPEGRQILIDGGPGSAVLEKLGREMPFWDRTLDLIILTHPEHDHIVGLIEVLQRYKVDYILWTGIKRETAEYKEWQNLIQKEGAEIIIAQRGRKIFLCDKSIEPELQYFIEILWPFENLEGQEVKNTNNSSVIARLVFGERSFLFTGDVYKSIERKLAKEGIYLVSDVLKVSHHGSKTSTSREFIEAVSPRMAVIQCGKDNRYGHPHPQTLAILEEFGIKILRTDLHGDIKIISDGINYVFSNF